MLDFSLKLCMAASSSPVVSMAVIVASLNMLVQITFSIVFGSKGICKIRGYRGE